MDKAKGINFVDMVKFLRVRREESLKIMPEELQHYLDARISVSAWYPEADMIGLVRVLVQLMPETEEDPLVLIGRINARQHIKGAYKHLFESSELSTLPLRASTLWKSMHDSGEFRLVMGDASATAEVSGYSHPSPEMCVMIRPYIEELLRASGIEGIRVEKESCCRKGDSACRYAVSWDSHQA